MKGGGERSAWLKVQREWKLNKGHIKGEIKGDEGGGSISLSL